MSNIWSFAAGFAAGWVGRSAFGSSRDAVVDLVAFGLQTIEHLKRAAFMETEHLDDVWAEARASVKARRARRAAREAADHPMGSVG